MLSLFPLFLLTATSKSMPGNSSPLSLSLGPVAAVVLHGSTELCQDAKGAAAPSGALLKHLRCTSCMSAGDPKG